VSVLDVRQKKNEMKKPLLRTALIFGTIIVLSGCVTPNEELHLLYGPLPPEQFLHTTQQLDAMGIDYEIRNGNEIYLTKSESERIRGGLRGGLSSMPVEIIVEPGAVGNEGHRRAD
jgi:flagellar biosynthesis/type III secretory pathway M-ring protein FliF/YscJ